MALILEVRVLLADRPRKRRLALGHA